jgi:hypothetical protein
MPVAITIAKTRRVPAVISCWLRRNPEAGFLPVTFMMGRLVENFVLLGVKLCSGTIVLVVLDRRLAEG